MLLNGSVATVLFRFCHGRFKTGLFDGLFAFDSCRLNTGHFDRCHFNPFSIFIKIYNIIYKYIKRWLFLEVLDYTVAYGWGVRGQPPIPC